MSTPASAGKPRRSEAPLLEIADVNDLGTQAEVKVLRQSRVVAQPNLERHASLQDPQARLGGLQPGENPLEEHSSSEPIDADPGGLGPSEEAIFQSDAQRFLSLVAHEASTK